MQTMLPPAPELAAFAKDLVTRIGTVGDSKHRLAVIFGLLAFDNTDAEIRKLVDSAFTIALEQHVAVGFHIDDSMFWARRKDLLDNPANLEWLDWSGTPSTGRRIDWGPQPSKIPPQLCYNSPAVEKAVRNRAGLFGAAIKAGRDRLKQSGKEGLFAGVIAGSEVMIGQDFDTGKYLGFHALTNQGFSKSHPPTDLDAAREKVVEEFIELWVKSLADAGVPRDEIFSHVAFLPKKVFDENPNSKETYSEHNHFASTSVAFVQGCRPGFSSYPQPGLYDQIYAELNRHGNPHWASSEGTNLQLGSVPGQSGMNMETYLAKMFNHGATLVNIYSWGLGGDANKKMDFRVVTEGDEALIAYRKFLMGRPLTESAVTMTSILERLPAKIHRIQEELPNWLQRTGGQAKVEPLMQALDAALKANRLDEAEKLADQILEILSK